MERHDLGQGTHPGMDFAAFDLNLLRVLDALLREGSTVKAGERLGLSQPAVSAALGRLRLAFDDELFIRQGTRLVPTDRVARLAIPLREELARMESLLTDDGAFEPERAAFSFRIAGADYFAELLMPALADRLSRTAPGIRLHLVDLVRDVYVESLEQFKADIALHPEQAVPDWVSRRPLVHADFALIAARGHPAIAASGAVPGEPLPLDLYCDLGHVLFSPEGNVAADADGPLARLGRKRRVVLTLPFFVSICRAVAQTDLISLVPVQVAERMAPLLGLDLFQPPFAVPGPLLVATWHRRNDGNPAHRWMRQQIAAVLEPYADERIEKAERRFRPGP